MILVLAKVYVSQSPSQLFDFLPSALLGRSLYEAVDLFGQWQEQGEDCLEALEALMIFSEANKGASWRVGVIPLLAEDFDMEAPSMEGQSSVRAASRNMSARMMSSVAKPRPAVMQVVRLQGSDAVKFGQKDGGDSTRSHGVNDAVAEMRLWRPGMAHVELTLGLFP